MRTGCAAGFQRQIGNRFQNMWPGRLRTDVEDEDLAAVESGSPELLPVIGEATMMSFVASTDRIAVDQLCHNWRTSDSRLR